MNVKKPCICCRWFGFAQVAPTPITTSYNIININTVPSAPPPPIGGVYPNLDVRNDLTPTNF